MATLFVSRAGAAAPVDLSVRMTTITLQVGVSNTVFVAVTNRGPVDSDAPITIRYDLPNGTSFLGGGADGFDCGVSRRQVTCVHPGSLFLDFTSTFPINLRVCDEALPAVEHLVVVEYPNDSNASNNVASRFTNVRPGDAPATGCGSVGSTPTARQSPATAAPTATPTPSSTPTEPFAQATRTRPITRPGRPDRPTRVPRTGPERTPHASPIVPPGTTRTDLKIEIGILENFRIGAAATYFLIVENIGESATNGVITVTDQIPTELQFLEASGAGWSCALNGQTLTCTRNASMGTFDLSAIALVVRPTKRVFPPSGRKEHRDDDIRKRPDGGKARLN